MRKRFILFILLCVMSIAGASYYIHYVQKSVPAAIYMECKSSSMIDLNTSFVGVIEGSCASTSVNLNKPVKISTGDTDEYTLSLKLFGLFNIKDIKVLVSDKKTVIPCGIPVGIYIESEGVVIQGFGDIKTDSGVVSSPAKEILMPGDYILAINETRTTNLTVLLNKINAIKASKVTLKIKRGDDIFYSDITPVLAEDGKYKIGIWTRDDCQGLGTLTYIDENGAFGTLGHSIVNSGTGEAFDLKNGSIYTANVWSIVKSTEGKPGELMGSINYGKDNFIGKITKNCSIGVYGRVDDNIYNFLEKRPIEIAYKQDIKKDKAYIKSFVGGMEKYYEIKITEINYSDEKENKGIKFKVVDEELLELTGGIVQGMSGSPIIQNNKMIGAVTHVLISDPKCGYGIFIENMLE